MCGLFFNKVKTAHKIFDYILLDLVHLPYPTGLPGKIIKINKEGKYNDSTSLFPICICVCFDHILCAMWLMYLYLVT